MPWHLPNCSVCRKATFVTFTKTDGKQSRQTRIARGTVTIELHIKTATHSSKHVSDRRTYCCECAADALIEQFTVVQRLLLDPAGIDPPREQPAKRGPNRPPRSLVCPGCSTAVFFRRPDYLEHVNGCKEYELRSLGAMQSIRERRGVRRGAVEVLESGADVIERTLGVQRTPPRIGVLPPLFISRNELEAEMGTIRRENQELFDPPPTNVTSIRRNE